MKNDFGPAVQIIGGDLGGWESRRLQGVGGTGAEAAVSRSKIRRMYVVAVENRDWFDVDLGQHIINPRFEEVLLEFVPCDEIQAGHGLIDD